MSLIDKAAFCLELDIYIIISFIVFAMCILKKLEDAGRVMLKDLILFGLYFIPDKSVFLTISMIHVKVIGGRRLTFYNLLIGSIH